MKEKNVTIERLAYGGEGVAKSEGKVVFVPFTAVGDKVRIKVVTDHGRFERGELLEIIKPSPDRISPACTVFEKCGGCQWQHLSYESQLHWKQEILRETLLRVGKIENPFLLPMIPSPKEWHYRHRIQLKADHEGRLGFYALRSHHVIPFDVCLISDPRLNEEVARLRASPHLFKKGFELALENSSVVKRHHEEEAAFSQVNPEQNRNLVQTVLDFSFGNAEKAFTQKKTVVELYAGSGNFTFPLAEKVGRVVAVEDNREAVRLAKERAEKEEIKQIEWIQGTAEWGLKKIYRRRFPVDLLVLDPPRRGVKEILDLIPLLKPRTIVYVSCDPTTLARDLQDLVRRHYKLEKIQPIDMFPQTYHIESVAQLSLI